MPTRLQIRAECYRFPDTFLNGFSENFLKESFCFPNGKKHSNDKRDGETPSLLLFDMRGKLLCISRHIQRMAICLLITRIIIAALRSTIVLPTIRIRVCFWAQRLLLNPLVISDKSRNIRRCTSSK